MATIQLNFTLRTSAHCKTAHLLGSWDNYAGQLPLSKDPAKPGAWRGTFKFAGATLRQGQRYWYYYILDGYHASHDPARDYTTEPTTGRKLNVLDIPGKPTPAPPTGRADTRASAAAAAAVRHTRNPSSLSIPKGRSLSPSKIVSPRPVKPHQTRHIVRESYHPSSVAALNARFDRATALSASSHSPASSSSSAAPSSPLSAGAGDFDLDSDSDISATSSSVPSLTSRSSDAGSPSSASSVSSASSCCTCERYGLTRTGQRIRIDCGGARCGFVSSDSECESSDDDDGGDDDGHVRSGGGGAPKVGLGIDGPWYEYDQKATRRQGIVVRG